MTGLEGNRQIYLPREIQDRLPKSFYNNYGFIAVFKTMPKPIINHSNV